MSAPATKHPPILQSHHDWLGQVQPTGLFLAPRVLTDKGAAPTEPIAEVQKALGAIVADGVLTDPWRFLTEVLGWPEGSLHRGVDLPPEDALVLEGGIRVAPDFALRDLDDPVNVLLGMIVPPSVRLDDASDDAVWSASAHQRFERLLRARECPVGVLTNHRSVRIVYAPRGEATAHATWHIRDLVTVAGRPMLAALHMCLNASRLLTLDADQRLGALLAHSREFQNTVSTRLQGQVLDALQELFDGLQRADRITDGQLLAPCRTSDADRQGIYRALVTALLRLVFILFAEERRLLPLDAKRYRESYALTSLHASLREDHARLGNRLDARYGAWGRIIALFRLLHDGLDASGLADGFSIIARRGDFFDPDRFPFLEGRTTSTRTDDVPLDLPKISDGTVFRVLDRLLVLEGERLKYGELAVEQIGAVYEGIMGYTLEVAEGRALRIRLQYREKSGVLDVVVDLHRFETTTREGFLKHLVDDLELKLSEGVKTALKKARTEAEVITSLSQQRSFQQTTAIDRGWMYLQPGEERRRSGSHYTPRSLTEPIVERTLAPVLARLGEHPHPDAILALRVCDPAMGSGAFLVEVCRQLAARLEEAWKHHGLVPAIPPDEDLHLHARRRVAQRCLYGVDRNALAVDLARLSLWLETFARDHAFTFLDHALRHGDTLLGLSLEQIASVSLETDRKTQLDLVRVTVANTLTTARRLRREIHAMGDVDPADNAGQRLLWREVEECLVKARAMGDLVIAGFFLEKSDRARKMWLEGRHAEILSWFGGRDEGRGLRSEVAEMLATRDLVPFHWPLEFPEVFDGERPGFDAFVGNPPYAGKNNLIAGHAAGYLDWLKALHEESHGNSDVVAHFFRRAFGYLREGGALGFLATNTVAQGDTRSTGLRWICTHGGEIFWARRRFKWPGVAAVVVTVVHLVRGPWVGPRTLDEREVEMITAFLFHRGGHESPKALAENAGKSFQGCNVLGKGFTFDDREKDRDAVNSLAEMRALIEKDPRNAERIFPYLGGEELNDDPEQKPHRYVINFGEMTEPEARAWPDLMEIVERKVKEQRGKSGPKEWWQFERLRPELMQAIHGKRRVLALARVSDSCAFAFLSTGFVYSEMLVVFPDDRDSFLSSLQSRLHEAWARFFGSSMKDDLRYTPSDCFETFPFPPNCETNATLDDIGRRYHEHRAALMRATVGTKHPEGLTATYNRFHDPNDRTPGIVTLRALHAEMDRAVLDAYGWTDVRPVYDYRKQLDERIRYTWDEATHDEVLARLLDENRRRVAADAGHVEVEAEGGASGAETKKGPSPKAKGGTKPKGKGKSGTTPPGLPGVE